MVDSDLSPVERLSVQISGSTNPRGSLPASAEYLGE